MSKELMKQGEPQHSNPQNITKEKLRTFLPKGTSHAVTDEIMNAIYQMEDDTGLEQSYMEEQLLANMNVMKALKVDLLDYVNALKFCTLKQNMSNRRAWEITFPDRLARAEAKLAEREAQGKGKSVNIDSHVSNYNKTEIVTKISSQLMVAVHILYAPMHHAAIKKQFDLMNGKACEDVNGNPMNVSPHIQHLAAKELALLTKAPEDAKLEVDVTVNQGSIIDEYEKAIAMMATAKMDAIKGGANMLETINAPVRADEIIDVTPDEFDPLIHDVEVYEKYQVIVEAK